MPEWSGLRPLEERLRLIEEKLSVGTWSWEHATDQVVWSPGLYRLLGVDASAVSASLTFFESLVHPHDRLPFHESEPIATDARQRSRRFRLIRPDGSLRWVSSLAQTIFNRAGEIARVTAVATDISELEELRRAVNSAKEFDKAIANLLQVEFWKSDEHGNLLEASNWLKQYGATPQAVYSQGWRAVVPAEDQEQVRAAWKAAVDEQREYAQTHSIRLADGSRRLVHVRGVPFNDPDASQPRWIGIASLEGGLAERLLPRRLDTTTDLAALPAQIRAARSYLGWSAEHLAAHAGVSLSTVRRFERGDRHVIRAGSIAAMVKALEGGGLSFWSDHRGRAYFVAG